MRTGQVACLTGILVQAVQLPLAGFAQVVEHASDGLIQQVDHRGIDFHVPRTLLPLFIRQLVQLVGDIIYEVDMEDLPFDVFEFMEYELPWEMRSDPDIGN